MQISNKVVTVIPAYNEEASISSVVKSVLRYSKVVVIDDGSVDSTKSIAEHSGAKVIAHHQNQGYDEALNTGLKFAISEGYDFVITMDADGQHNPDHLVQYIRLLAEGADLVLGIRDDRQRWSESLFSLISKFLWGMSDPLCGMKGYRVGMITKLNLSRTYQSIGTEIAIRAANAGLKISEVPIASRKRDGSSRFGSGFRANKIITFALFRGILLRWVG